MTTFRWTRPRRLALAAAAACLTVVAGAVPSTAASAAVYPHCSGVCTAEDLTLPAAAPAPPGLDTGLVVSTGMHVRFKAKGKIGYGIEGVEGCVGVPQVDSKGKRYLPHGVVCSPPKKLDPNAVAPDAPIGSLIYRAGDGPWAYAAPDGEVVVPTSGELYVAVNDSFYADNTGAFTVDAKVE
jgi:hypothetical protein